MVVKKDIQDQILAVISGIGTNGATIIEIEKKVSIERHTLSKYLVYMQGLGLLNHKAVGKAKVWHINNDPIQNIMKKSSMQRTFAENLLLNLIEHIPIGVIVTDRDYNIQFINEMIVQRYGNVDDKKFYSEILGLENPLKIAEISRVINGNEKFATIQMKDKDANLLGIRATRLENPDSSFSLILLIDDVTKSKLMEEKLKKLSSALEQTGDFVFITNRKGVIEYVNQSFEQQTGYKKEDAIGKTPRILKSGKHKAEFYEKIWKALLTGRTYKGLLINRKKNGKLYYERKTITPIKDEHRNITHFVSIGKDVTESIHSLRKMRQNIKNNNQ